MQLYHAVFVVTILFGLILGFSFDGTLILIGGILLSLFSEHVWHDIIFANIVSFVTLILANMFFSGGRKE